MKLKTRVVTFFDYPYMSVGTPRSSVSMTSCEDCIRINRHPQSRNTDTNWLWNVKEVKVTQFNSGTCHQCGRIFKDGEVVSNPYDAYVEG